jgi:F-type H+-transporting ATPase subunit epsilon
VNQPNVTRIVARTIQGAVGLLPNRLDCAAVLTPGILTYETEAEGEVNLAVDHGVLVKVGPDVLISVRDAVAGSDLKDLHDAVKREFLAMDDQEKSVRSELVRMETGFIRRFMEFRRD